MTRAAARQRSLNGIHICRLDISAIQQDRDFGGDSTGFSLDPVNAKPSNTVDNAEAARGCTHTHTHTHRETRALLIRFKLILNSEDVVRDVNDGTVS